MVEYNKLRLEEYNGEIKLENNDLFFIDFMEYGQMPQQISARLLVDNNACFYVLVFFWKQSSSLQFYIHGDLPLEIKTPIYKLFENEQFQYSPKIDIKTSRNASAGYEHNIIFKNKYTTGQYHLELRDQYVLRHKDKDLIDSLNKTIDNLDDWFQKIYTPYLDLMIKGIQHFEIYKKSEKE